MLSESSYNQGLLFGAVHLAQDPTLAYHARQRQQDTADLAEELEDLATQDHVQLAAAEAPDRAAFVQGWIAGARWYLAHASVFVEALPHTSIRVGSLSLDPASATPLAELLGLPGTLYRAVDICRLPGVRKGATSLAQAGVTTINALCALPPRTLLKMPGVRRITFQRICQELPTFWAQLPASYFTPSSPDAALQVRGARCPIQESELARRFGVLRAWRRSAMVALGRPRETSVLADQTLLRLAQTPIRSQADLRGILNTKAQQTYGADLVALLAPLADQAVAPYDPALLPTAEEWQDLPLPDPAQVSTAHRTLLQHALAEVFLCSDRQRQAFGLYYGLGKTPAQPLTAIAAELAVSPRQLIHDIAEVWRDMKTLGFTLARDPDTLYTAPACEALVRKPTNRTPRPDPGLSTPEPR